MRFLTLAAAAAASLASFAAHAEPLKVGFIYVGPIGDLGWTFRHDEGRKAIEAALGDDVITTYKENVEEGAAAVDAITDMAEAGQDLIFTTSFGYMDPTNQVAKNYPNVKFEHATGFKRESDNVTTFSARFYEGRVVQGMIAAKTTKTNKIGYIASFPIPEVIRGINAFTTEMQKHNPEAEVEIIWAFTWFDPAKEAAAANTLIDNGADIIVQHTDSPAAMQVAEARGVKAFGQASDMSRFGPTAHLVSIVDNWDSYYIDRAMAVKDGTWASQDTWWGFTKDGMGGEIGMVELGSYGNMPQELIDEAKALEKSLAEGERHALPCPINKQDGTLVQDCADGGEHLSDLTLVTMDFYTEGVTGNIPQ